MAIVDPLSNLGESKNLFNCHGEGDFWGLMFAPSVLVGTLGEYSLGVPCWMLFGWWWPEPKPMASDSSDEKKTEQPLERERRSEPH
jgi:hypothetical protein